MTVPYNTTAMVQNDLIMLLSFFFKASAAVRVYSIYDLETSVRPETMMLPQMGPQLALSFLVNNAICVLLYCKTFPMFCFPSA